MLTKELINRAIEDRDDIYIKMILNLRKGKNTFKLKCGCEELIPSLNNQKPRSQQEREELLDELVKQLAHNNIIEDEILIEKLQKRLDKYDSLAVDEIEKRKELISELIKLFDYNKSIISEISEEKLVEKMKKDLEKKKEDLEMFCNNAIYVAKNIDYLA